MIYKLTQKVDIKKILTKKERGKLRYIRTCDPLAIHISDLNMIVCHKCNTTCPYAKELDKEYVLHMYT